MYFGDIVICIEPLKPSLHHLDGPGAELDRYVSLEKNIRYIDIFTFRAEKTKRNITRKYQKV